MNYDELTMAYWLSQVERISKLRDEIVSRGDAISSGRVVPEATDLAIGTGRQLSTAILFVDICDFSSRPAVTMQDQETLLRVINLFFTEMIKIAEDYGGTVEKNTGDGLMAYFPDGPASSESGAQRAVAAAMSMMFANDFAITPILNASGVAPIAFRVGIDYGEVTIANLGAPRRFNSYVAVGSHANIACKMLAVAGPKEIVLGDNVPPKLPSTWAPYVRLKKFETGWIRPMTGLPYSFWQFDGRWVEQQ